MIVDLFGIKMNVDKYSLRDKEGKYHTSPGLTEVFMASMPDHAREESVVSESPVK